MLARICRTDSRVGRSVGSSVAVGFIVSVFVTIAVGLAVADDLTISVRVAVVVGLAVTVSLISGVTLTRICRTATRVGRLVGSSVAVFMTIAVGLAVVDDTTVSVRVAVVVALAVAGSLITGVTLARICRTVSRVGRLVGSVSVFVAVAVVTCCRSRLDNLDRCRCGCLTYCRRWFDLRRDSSANLPHCLTRWTLGWLNCLCLRGRRCRTCCSSRLDSFGMCRCGRRACCSSRFDLRRDARANLPHYLTRRTLSRLISGSRLQCFSLGGRRCRTCCSKRLDSLGKCRCGCRAIADAVSLISDVTLSPNREHGRRASDAWLVHQSQSALQSQSS